jgi:hypothetical protein
MLVGVGATVGELLDQARAKSFVGRAAELDSFGDALTGDAPHRLIFVHGPGGIGKTTLLSQFRTRAVQAGRQVLEFDGRDHGLTRDTIAEAVADSSEDSALVVLIDGYELLDPLDPWLRSELLPSLSADSITIIASRRPPSTDWRSDPGWRQLMAVHLLRDLDLDEGADLLARAGVPPQAHERLLELSHGLPLALALLAAAAAADQVPAGLADAPDVVEALLPVFVENVPSDDHAAALELCSHSWVITIDLLEFRFGEQANELWQWLGSLPFVARSHLGLYPHDLAREVLLAEYVRRGGNSQRRVQRVLHRYSRDAIRDKPAKDAYVVALQLLYLHRDRPLTKGFWDLRENRGVSVVPARSADHQVVVDLVARREGAEQGALAARWLQAEPGALRVIRQGAELAGFAFEPVLPADPGLEADDPVTRAVLEGIRQRCPLRPGEQLSIGRFFGADSDAYQADPLAVVCGSVGSLVTWQVRSLAWSWIVTNAAEFWDPVFDYLGFDNRLVIPGDATRVAFGMDWRRVGITAWNEMMAERELSGVTGPPPTELLRPPPLSLDAFQAAVRAALPLVRSPDALGDSALLGSQLVVETGPGGEARLARMIQGAVDELGSAPATEELQRVLDRTFLHGAPSQEAAAEVLGLSFSTYRRRLSRAMDALVDVLWAVEIGRRSPESLTGLEAEE